MNEEDKKAKWKTDAAFRFFFTHFRILERELEIPFPFYDF